MKRYGNLSKETTDHTSPIPFAPLNSAFSVSLSTVVKVGIHRIRCENTVVPNIDIGGVRGDGDSCEPSHVLPSTKISLSRLQEHVVAAEV